MFRHLRTWLYRRRLSYVTPDGRTVVRTDLLIQEPTVRAFLDDLDRRMDALRVRACEQNRRRIRISSSTAASQSP